MPSQLNPPTLPPEVEDETQSIPVELPDVATEPHPSGRSVPSPPAPDLTQPEDENQPPIPGSHNADDAPEP